MKYFEEFKVYEAFDSDVITKITKFLANDNKNRKIFINSLTDIMKSYDLPINRIKDSHIKYLKANDAFKVKNTDHVENGLGIYCIKFWFSINLGYLGFTATGNKRIDYSESKEYDFELYGDEIVTNLVDRFTEEEIEHIKNVIGIKSGTLKRLPRYGNYSKRGNTYYLNNEDNIIAYYCSTMDISRLAMARVYIKNNNKYGIQNVSNGDSTDGDWKKYGKFSWSIEGDDTIKPHIYYKDSYISNMLRDEIIKNEKSIYNYNLPLSLNNGIYMFTDWFDYFKSMNNKNLDNADYCIVLYLDDVLKTAKSITQIKYDKSLSREGSTKFISDNDIRASNISRYSDEILNRKENYVSISFVTLWDRITNQQFDDISFKFMFNKNGVLTKIENEKNFDLPTSWIGEVNSSELTTVIMDYFDSNYKIHKIRIKYGKKYNGDIFNIDKFEYLFRHHINGIRRFKDSNNLYV